MLTFRVEVETDPREATIELDGQPAGSGSLDQRLPSDGNSHVMVVRAPGYRDATVRFTDRSPPHLLALERVTPPKADPKADGAKSDLVRNGSGSARPEEDSSSDRFPRAALVDTPGSAVPARAVRDLAGGAEARAGHRPAAEGEPLVGEIRAPRRRRTIVRSRATTLRPRTTRRSSTRSRRYGVAKLDVAIRKRPRKSYGDPINERGRTEWRGGLAPPLGGRRRCA